MKTLLILALGGLGSCASVGQELSQNSNPEGNLNTAARTNRVSFYLGGRGLDDSDWRPVDDQGVFGAEFSHRVSTVGWEVGYMLSAANEKSGGTRFKGRMDELYGGLRVGLGDDVVRPYVGAGVSLLKSQLEVGGSDDDDNGIGAYAHGGLTVDLSPRVYVGLDGRILLGPDLSVSGFDRSTDYRQLALVLGFAF